LSADNFVTHRFPKWFTMNLSGLSAFYMHQFSKPSCSSSLQPSNLHISALLNDFPLALDFPIMCLDLQPGSWLTTGLGHAHITSWTPAHLDSIWAAFAQMFFLDSHHISSRASTRISSWHVSRSSNNEFSVGCLSKVP
jgi:hypothetical protein